MNVRSFFGTIILAGTIIGAGIFSLPYVVSRIGLIPGFLFLCVFGAIYCVLHMMYASLGTLHTEKHQFFFFAHKYLPLQLASFASYSILIELVLVLTVYLTLIPSFGRTVFGYESIGMVILFWFLGSIFINANLKWLGIAEFVGTVGILGIIVLLFIESFGKPLLVPSVGGLSFSLLILPFGPMLFSLSGRPAISDVVAEYKHAQKEHHPFSLMRSICVGTLIPVVLYALFVVSVLKLNPHVSPESLDSLTSLSPTLLSLVGILGFITLWTSYFMIGINIRDILHFDLHESRWIGSAVVWIVPLALYFGGVQNFLTAVSVAGGIFLALEGVFVAMMWNKAFPTRRDRWVRWPLYFVFFTAIIYEIFYFVA